MRIVYGPVFPSHLSRFTVWSVCAWRRQQTDYSRYCLLTFFLNEEISCTAQYSLKPWHKASSMHLIAECRLFYSQIQQAPTYIDSLPLKIFFFLLQESDALRILPTNITQIFSGSMPFKGVIFLRPPHTRKKSAVWKWWEQRTRRRLEEGWEMALGWQIRARYNYDLYVWKCHNETPCFIC